jgi:hypothetical protein
MSTLKYGHDIYFGIFFLVGLGYEYLGLTEAED